MGVALATPIVTRKSGSHCGDPKHIRRQMMFTARDLGLFKSLNYKIKHATNTKGGYSEEEHTFKLFKDGDVEYEYSFRNCASNSTEYFKNNHNDAKPAPLTTKEDTKKFIQHLKNEVSSDDLEEVVKLEKALNLS